MLLKVTRISDTYALCFYSILYLMYSLTSFIYFKHLKLNTKQKRCECGRTLSRFQIGQNGSQLLSRESKTSRFGLPSSRWLDTTKEQGKMAEENRVQEERSPQLWLIGSCGGCIFGTIPCSFSLSFPVLRHVATMFSVESKGIMYREAPCRLPPCWLLGNTELACLPFSVASGYVEGPLHVGEWMDKRLDERTLWGCPQALPSLRSQLPSAGACGAQPALS